jgi:hypothetical protein
MNLTNVRLLVVV